MITKPDETTLKELFTRLSAVERANARMAQQLATLYAQRSPLTGQVEIQAFRPEQLSPVQESSSGSSIAPRKGRACNPAGLTAREVQVLQLVAQGCSDAEVAARLVITRRTVNWYLTTIYSKIGVSSRSAATRYAFEHQLISKDL